MDDIDLFYSAGRGRSNNDINNKKREDILCILYDPPREYANDPRWKSLSKQWREFLGTLCECDHDDVRLIKQGGRGKNYDFDIDYLQNGNVIKQVKAEFKHNASTLDCLPQYFSPADNKPYMPGSYAEFYYTHYLDSVCSLYGIAKPERTAYLKMVYSDNYSRLSMFEVLYTADKAGHDDRFEQRAKIVKESVEAYLRTNKDNLDMAKLSADIRDRQAGKVFILWDLKTFRADTIRDEEMDIVATEGIKNGNVLVAVSRAGTRHNMLLRWKNHLGVLYPAWQISLSR